MYERYLQEMLRPLGIYDLSADTIGGAELYAVGKSMDLLDTALEYAERECLAATAEDVGLTLREKLFAGKSGAESLEDRRTAIAALLQIGGDSLTPEAMTRTLRGCGLRVHLQEMGDGLIRVLFPDVVGEPEDFAQIKKIILEILPCHLEVEFYFDYLTWETCQMTKWTWQMIEDSGQTWDSFMTLGA